MQTIYHVAKEEIRRNLYSISFPTLNFIELAWSVIDRLRANLNNLAVLFLWSVIFFVSAHCIFVKRSLR
jgi:hypothetical protein